MQKGYYQRSKINLNKGIEHTDLEGYQMDSASADSVSDTNNEEGSSSAEPLSRYEAQKRRDWTTFLQYLKNHKPPLSLARCSGAHVIEFMKYLDQFGKTKVHVSMCTYFGCLHPPAACTCPLKQAWGSLDALVGRIRAAYEENGGQPDCNPFGSKAVRIYLKGVRDEQAKARGISYEKKRKRLTAAATTSTIVIGTSAQMMQGADDQDGRVLGCVEPGSARPGSHSTRPDWRPCLGLYSENSSVIFRS